MPDNVNITVNETIENVVVNPSITTEVIDVNITGTTETVNIDVTPNLTTININSISGSPVTKTSDLINDGEDGINPFITLADVPPGGLTSVGLSMPVAFNVANSPLTSNGTLAVNAAGTSSQYIRGDGQLATLPTGAGGGSTVAYYLNGSINASVAGYKQLSNTATIGGGTDFTLVGNGLIAQFLTDLGNPNRLEIPGGAWNFEMYFQSSSAGGSPKFYVELLKYNGTIFTSVASTISVPEEITGGTAIDLYLTSLAVPTTTLLVTDRLAIRVYIVDNSGGRTITLHTEDNTLCEIITTFSGGVTSLNGLTANTQYLAVGTTGTDFNISSLTDTHTFNLPTASATNRGALSTTDWTAFNGKFTLPSLTSGSVLFSNGTTIAQDNSNFFWDDTNNRLNLGGVTSNTARLGIKAPGALSTDIALQVRNSADTENFLRVNGIGATIIKSIGGGSATNFSVSSSGAAESFNVSENGIVRFRNVYTFEDTQAIAFFGGRDVGNSFSFSYLNGPSLNTATRNHLRLGGAIGFAGGTNEWNALYFNEPISTTGAATNEISFIKINPTINTTVGTSILRGLYYNPILTSLTGTTHRAIETVSGNVLFNTTSGNTLVGTTTDNGGKLQIKAPGALSTDIALRVRNSADNADLATIGGTGNLKVNGIINLNTGNALHLTTGFNNYDGNCIYSLGSATFLINNRNICIANFFNNGSDLTQGIQFGYGIATTQPPNVACALLDLTSTTKGFLPPRMTTTQKNAIATPASGLVVYDTTLGKLCVRGAAAWETITSI